MLFYWNNKYKMYNVLFVDLFLSCAYNRDKAKLFAEHYMNDDRKWENESIWLYAGKYHGKGVTAGFPAASDDAGWGGGTAAHYR